jgi:hypothetical protein
MADAVAPVCLIASATLAKTGLPRCSEPAFLGFVPPITFVPYSIACCAWKLPQSQQARSDSIEDYHLRALLSREALEKHPGV